MACEMSEVRSMMNKRQQPNRTTTRPDNNSINNRFAKMKSTPVQLDITTAADFKGLLQTIVVRRFKNTIGVKYDVVDNGEASKFDSYVTLFNAADNKYLIQFPSTGLSQVNGERFKVNNFYTVQCCTVTTMALSLIIYLTLYW